MGAIKCVLLHAITEVTHMGSGKKDVFCSVTS